MISRADIWLLAPQIILALGAVILLLSIAVKRSHRLVSILTLLTLAVAFWGLFWSPALGGSATPIFLVDGTGRFFTGLILCASFVVILLSYPYFADREGNPEEFYVLEILATLGAVAMVISAGFVSFFLSLEVLSVSLYGLIAYQKKESAGIEAGLKYLVLAAVSSAFLLFGIALLYFQTGHLDLAGIGQALNTTAPGPLFLAGFAMIIVGIGFKLALVPFHLWTPDIYSGASAPVSAFVATVSKGAVFAFLLRMFDALHGEAHPSVWLALAVLAGASMLIGNWLGLRQQLIKRLLAYSSIGHLGYLLVALLAAGTWGARAGAFYLTVYFVSMLGAFGAVGCLAGANGEARSLEDYRGLFFSRPWLAAFFTTVLLSLAGIPLTAGFLGKLYILSSGAAAGKWVLLIILVVSSTIGLFYYLRVISVMFSRHQETPGWDIQSAFPMGITLAVLFILLLWLGIFPDSLIHLIQGLVVHVP